MTKLNGYSLNGIKDLMPKPLLPPPPLDLRIAFISTYPPRKCGIATFTKDLATSINNLNPNRPAEIIVLDNSISKKLEYPWEVSYRIDQDNWSDYETILNYLNRSVIDVISIQHEFGIFGGQDGEYIINFVKKLEKPYIVTLHTVLENPNDNQKRIIKELCLKSAAIVVMLPVAVEILHQVYQISLEKIVMIHHGAPDLPFFIDNEAKKLLGVEDKIVMSSINLISSGKGLEYAIKALPKIVKRYPNFIYLIVGQTHPVVLEEQGEKYRHKLESLVKRLKLDMHVKFINEYISLDDLISYIRASDFYITPYENTQQISSGALAYAIAAGRLCISTPYKYANEMLSGGKGYLVKIKSAKDITEVVLDALSHPGKSFKMRQKCYFLGRTMTWQQVGFRYIRMLDHILGKNNPLVYTMPSLDHLDFLTTSVGLLEHSDKGAHNIKEGYATDDNARGLIVAIIYKRKDLAEKYLDFLIHAQKDGLMYCDANSQGHWEGKPKIGDHFGRTFWAVSFAVNFGPTFKIRQNALDMVEKLLLNYKKGEDLRTLAYILLGLAFLKNIEWDEFKKERLRVIDHILYLIKQGFKKYRNSDWYWPEPNLTYDNARIPQALLEVGMAYGNNELIVLGVEMLNFLLDHTFSLESNHFKFIGNKGWFEQGKERAEFDEQPIEAGSTTQACYSAYKATNLSYYKEMAIKSFAWYHGDNCLRRPLYNHTQHSVYDGITASEININQGAESVLEYLLAFDCYAKLIEEIEIHDQVIETPSIRKFA